MNILKRVAGVIIILGLFVALGYVTGGVQGIISVFMFLAGLVGLGLLVVLFVLGVGLALGLI